MPSLLCCKKCLTCLFGGGRICSPTRNPCATRLDKLGSLVGNEQFAAIVDAKGELKELYKTWKAAKSKEGRTPAPLGDAETASGSRNQPARRSRSGDSDRGDPLESQSA